MRLLDTRVGFDCKNIDELGKLMCSLIGDLGFEALLAAYLDEDMRLKGIVHISSSSEIGGLHSLNDIYFCAVRLESRNIIVAHNHPNGNTTPSNGDIVSTRKMLDILKLNNVALVDHLIVCNNSYQSFIKMI